MEGEGVRSARGEGGGQGNSGGSLANTECSLLTILTPANGITCPDTKEATATRLELVVEFELLRLPRE